MSWSIAGLGPAEISFIPLIPDVIRVNVGGPELTINGITWDADVPTQWSGSFVYDYGTVSPIANTSDDELFITQRYSLNMTRSFDLPAGNYVVTLIVAEQNLSVNSIGDRVWSANANGALWTSIDVWDLVETKRAVRLERNVVVGSEGLEILFTSPVGGAFVNAIEIRPGADAVADPAPMAHEGTGGGTGSGIATDPDANAATTSLLNLVKSFSAATGVKSVMAGQHVPNQTDMSEINALETIWGERIAVMSVDVAQRYTQTLVNICKTQHDRGGIIMVGAHSPNPVTGLPAWNDMQTGDPGAVNHDILMNSGNSQNTAFVNHLNDIADFFQALNALGIPVMFRPLHEVTNTGFWWCPLRNGSVTPLRHRQLWAYIWNHIVNVRGCHNVLFLWSNQKNFNLASSELGTRQDWMPDATKVDIGGMSAYTHTSTQYPAFETQKVRDWLDAYTAKWPGKPAAVSETGGDQNTAGRFDTRSLQHMIHTSFPGRFAFFVCWNGSKHRLHDALNPAIITDNRTAWIDDI